MTTRGSGRTIEAAVAMFDLRGFTALSDTYSRDDVIALLNDYFDAVAEPIDHRGGEILKFMETACSRCFRSTGSQPAKTR